MKRNRERNEKEEPCETCGDKGFVKKLLKCSRCGAREHNYCIRAPLPELPKVWVCEACQETAKERERQQDSSNIPKMNQRYEMREVLPSTARDNPLRQAALAKVKSVRNTKPRLPPVVPGTVLVSKKPPIPFITSSTTFQPPVSVEQDPSSQKSEPTKTSSEETGSKSRP